MDFHLADDLRQKQRRNRATQSCLNCHASKRKCDRKKPCSRCITLGLTGLCVYESEDPATRHDPNVDETSRYRNRIAELEAVIRELRGKPHPRWADHTGRHASFNTYTKPECFDNLVAFSDSSSDDSDARYGDSIKNEDIGVDPSLTIGDHALSAGYDPTYSPISSNPHCYAHSSAGSPFTDATASSSSSYPSPSLQPSYDAHNSSMTCTCFLTANTTLASLTEELERASNYLRSLPAHRSQDACPVLQRVLHLQSMLSSLTPRTSATLRGQIANPRPFMTSNPTTTSTLAHALSPLPPSSHHSVHESFQYQPTSDPSHAPEWYVLHQNWQHPVAITPTGVLLQPQPQPHHLMYPRTTAYGHSS